MKRSLGFSFSMMFVFTLSLLVTGLHQPLHAKKKKKEKDPFYRTTRFIMTKEEKEIYKHLEGVKDKARFAEEFWKKRDPDPTTEENESRAAYQKRIAYANKWFRETPKGEGWDTERGRVLLQLGFPDRREFGQAPQTRGGRLVTSKRIPMERWLYYRYQLMLVFTDLNDSGHLTMERIPSNLMTTMDLVKFSLNLTEEYNVLKRSFKFKASYHSGNLNVMIPVKKLSFEEKDGKMRVNFRTTVYVYHNNKKIDQLSVNKNYNWDKEELLNLKHIKFDVPYPLKEKGKYYFDVVVEELGSASKFRDMVKYKFKD
jgi:GWxTD domain-containing protein